MGSCSRARRTEAICEFSAVLSYCGHVELCRTAAASKSWCRLASGEELWRQLLVDRWTTEALGAAGCARTLFRTLHGPLPRPLAVSDVLLTVEVSGDGFCVRHCLELSELDATKRNLLSSEYPADEPNRLDEEDWSFRYKVEVPMLRDPDVRARCLNELAEGRAIARIGFVRKVDGALARFDFEAIDPASYESQPVRVAGEVWPKNPGLVRRHVLTVEQERVNRLPLHTRGEQNPIVHDINIQIGLVKNSPSLGLDICCRKLLYCPDIYSGAELPADCHTEMHWSDQDCDDTTLAAVIGNLSFDS